VDPITLDPTGADIQGEAARLRAGGPVVRVVLPGGVPAWAVTSHDVLRSLLMDARVSTDARQHWPAWINGEIPPDWPLGIWIAVRNMFTAHGADHRRLRGLVASAFTPRRIAALRPRIEEITDRLLAPLVGDFDLRERFTYPLPIEVICHLFGVPLPVWPDLRRLVAGVFATSATPEAAAANGFQLYTLLTELVAAKRADPADDLTSALIAANDDDDGTLSEAELVDTLLLMLGGGHETTVNLLGSAIVGLLSHPDQLESVRSGRSTWSDVIEETLRWQSPVAFLPMRYAIADIEITGGVVIRAGDPILVSYVAAGRDPDVHGFDAAGFDVGRATRGQHDAFGHGVHHCLGAPLARLEASIALPALFARFPDLALAAPVADLVPIPSFISHGYQALPVRNSLAHQD
jgi:cytochrome P450